MTKYLCSVLALVAVAFTSGSSFGAVLVSLSSTPGGAPVILNAGESISIDVLLQNLGGDTLDSLGVTVLFDGTLLGDPTSANFGSIVPDPASGILTVSPVSGAAAGLYDALFSVTGLPISTEGTFFTFQLTAQSVPAVSSASVTIVDASYFLTGVSDPFNADIGPSLDVQVNNTVIPEPSSMIVLGLGSIALLRSRKRVARLTKAVA